jgi:hypothetical protein
MRARAPTSLIQRRRNESRAEQARWRRRRNIHSAAWRDVLVSLSPKGIRSLPSNFLFACRCVTLMPCGTNHGSCDERNRLIAKAWDRTGAVCKSYVFWKCGEDYYGANSYSATPLRHERPTEHRDASPRAIRSPSEQPNSSHHVACGSLSPDFIHA